MEINGNEDSWKVYRKYVVAEIERLTMNQGLLDKKLSDYLLTSSVELGRLKVWSAIYGMIAGMVGTLFIREVLSRL
jgi:hypothetical protein